jgi:hypothetical protein
MALEQILQNYLINILNEVFEERLVSRILWPAKPVDLKSVCFLSVVQTKYVVHSYNLHTTFALKQITHETNLDLHPLIPCGSVHKVSYTDKPTIVSQALLVSTRRTDLCGHPQLLIHAVYISSIMCISVT